MAKDNITILCYWNGRIVSGSHGLTYEGALPKAIRVNNRISYDDLVSKIYDVTGFNRMQMRVKITCRYPNNFQEYIALPVEDNDDVSVVLDVMKRPGINCLDLYVEAIPQVSNELIETHRVIPDGPFTRLLMQEDEVSDFSFDVNTTGNNGSFDNAAATCIIEEVVANERNQFVTHGTQFNNNLLDENVDGADEGMNEDEIVYEKAPTTEFTTIHQIDDAVVDVLVAEKGYSRHKNGGDLFVGQRFSTKDELQTAVKLYSLNAHQQYQVTNSTSKLWILKCKKAPTCAWRLRASIPHGASFFEIKKYTGPHTCVNPIINRDHLQLDSRFVADQIKPLVKAQLSITLTAIQALISEKYSYEISKKKAWNAKQKAIVDLFGDWVESYKLLPRYMDVLQRENPGTIVCWDKEPAERNPGHETFNRVFWSFSASIEGFKYCRPVISVDGTHLYGKYKGTMLIAMSCDANGQLFTLAFAIVEGENNDSWSWFMATIRRYVTQRN